jgi:hypothetical protein
MADSAESGNDSPDLAALNEAADAAFDSAFTTEAAKPTTDAGSTPVPEPAKPESTETAQVAGSTPVAESQPVAPETQDAPEYQNLLAKYGGDKNAAAKSYWETAKTAAQLTKEKEELAAKLATYEAQGSTPKPQQTEQAVKEIPTQLRWYDDRIRETETNFAKTQAERATYTNVEDGLGPRLDAEISSLRRQLTSRDLTIDKDALNDRLIQALDDREKVTNYVAHLDQKLRGFDKEWQGYKENRSIREAILEQAKEIQATREAKAKEQEDRETSQFHETWFGTIDKVSKDQSVVPQIGSLPTKFVAFVKAMGMAEVANGNPIADVDKFVRQCAADFLSTSTEFHQAKAAEYGKLKKDDARIEGPKGSDALASETKKARADWTKQQWEQYEAQIEL